MKPNRMMVWCLMVMALMAGDRSIAGTLEVEEIIELGTGHSVQWSPSGRFVSFIESDLLKVYDIEAAAFRTFPAPLTEEYVWVTDNQVVSCQPGWDSTQLAFRLTLTFQSLDNSIEARIDSTVLKTVKMITRPKLYSQNDFVCLAGFDSTTPVTSIADMSRSRAVSSATAVACPYARAVSHFPVLWKGGKNVYGDTDIWLVDRAGKMSKRVTFGKEYRSAEFSSASCLIHCMDNGGHLVVLDTNGTELAKSFGADCPTWSPDGQRVIFAKLQYMGDHDVQISTGDLYALDVATSTEQQLTSSPNVVECNPVFSSTGKWIAYVQDPFSKKTKISLLRLGGDR